MVSLEDQFPQPTYSEDGQEIYLGDCLSILPKIQTGFVRLIFADPPYNIGKNFGNNKDFWPSKEEYFTWCREWIHSCNKLLTDDGSIFIMGHPQYIPYLMNILDSEGLVFTNQIIYHYADGMPEKDLFERRYEPILYYRKSKNKFVFNLDSVRVEPVRFDRYSNPRGKNPSDVWEINRVRWNSKERAVLNSRKIAHLTQKPMMLLERIVLACSNPGDVVLDPFLGTGTTSVVAKMKGRKSIGIEMNPDYVSTSIKRLQDAKIDSFSPTLIYQNIDEIEKDLKKIDEWIIPRDRHSFPLTNDFHPYFAAFPPELVDRLLEKFSWNNHKVLDPFCGGGSTIVESVLHGRDPIGIDISPLAALITKVKSTPILIQKQKLSSFLSKVNNKILQLKSRGDDDVSVPEENAKFLEKWYPKSNLSRLRLIRGMIEEEDDEDFRDFLKVALSSILRKSSYAKNAEQHLSRAVKKAVPDASILFKEKIELMARQMNEFCDKTRRGHIPKILTGDARKLSDLIPEETIDLVVTSPPYGTGSKYTGVYRLSFEWLGFQKPSSHESLELSKDFAGELKKCISEIYKVLRPNKYLCFVYGDPSAENGLTKQAISDGINAGFHYHGLITCPIVKEKSSHATKYRRFIPKDFILIFQK